VKSGMWIMAVEECDGEDWIGWMRCGGHLSWNAEHDKTLFCCQYVNVKVSDE
jgi:hypothetical protein